MSDPAIHSFDIDAPAADAPAEDFADAMQQLATEAEDAGRHAHGTPVSKAAQAEFLLAVGHMIRPMAVGVEDLGERVGKLTAAQATAIAPVLATLEGVRSQLGRMGNVESANQKLFDALHKELNGYKDSFLFDALQKPFVRDLIALHDDLSGLFTQIEARRGKTPAATGEAEFLTILAQNFDNARCGLLETFERLDVERHDTATGEPLDKRVHRVIAFEAAPEAGCDGQVARSLRPGFFWRGRCVRPEEVVAWRGHGTDPVPVPPLTPEVAPSL